MPQSNHSTRKRSGKGLSNTVFKVMGLFSGMQAIGIICSIIRTKIVALWLQATGVGLFGIFNSTIETIATFTDLGLRQSSVRDVAIADRNPSRLAIVISVVRRWSLMSGILGAIVISAASPLLSKGLFGNYDYWWCFALLSLSMFMNALLNGEQAIMQGTSTLRSLAKANLYGALAGLAVSIPLFYFLKEISVVLSIIAYSATALFFVIRFRYRCDREMHVTIRQTVREGKGFVRLGLYMAIATFITNIANLLFIAWLNRSASTTEVGFFQAGNTLIIRYSGLIFSAIGMEFFPRLAANHQSRLRTNLFVSHEITLILLVITPFIILFLLLREPIVSILYSSEFHAIIPMISWGIMSCVFRTAAWCMAYTIIAKGHGRTFILTESIDAAIGLALNIIFYRHFGLTGIGMSLVAWFAIYTIIIGCVYNYKYRLRLTSTAIRMILCSILVAFTALWAIESLPMQLNCILFPIAAACYLKPLRQLYLHRGKGFHKNKV